MWQVAGGMWLLVAAFRGEGPVGFRLGGRIVSPVSGSSDACLGKKGLIK